MTDASVRKSSRCDDLYQSVVALTDGGSQSLFDLAQCFIEGYDPEKLRFLLKAEDEGLLIDGLFIVSEIGQLARNYSIELAALAKHPDPEIRTRAAKLSAMYS